MSMVIRFLKDREKYETLLKSFSNPGVLESRGIKSISFIMEDFNSDDPLPPRLLIKKLNGEEEKIDGVEKIKEYFDLWI